MLYILNLKNKWFLGIAAIKEFNLKSLHCNEILRSWHHMVGVQNLCHAIELSTQKREPNPSNVWRCILSLELLVETLWFHRRHARYMHARPTNFTLLIAPNKFPSSIYMFIKPGIILQQNRIGGTRSFGLSFFISPNTVEASFMKFPMKLGTLLPCVSTLCLTF